MKLVKRLFSQEIALYRGVGVGPELVGCVQDLITGLGLSVLYRELQLVDYEQGRLIDSDLRAVKQLGIALFGTFPDKTHPAIEREFCKKLGLCWGVLNFRGARVVFDQFEGCGNMKEFAVLREAVQVSWVTSDEQVRDLVDFVFGSEGNRVVLVSPEREPQRAEFYNRNCLETARRHQNIQFSESSVQGALGEFIRETGSPCSVIVPNEYSEAFYCVLSNLFPRELSRTLCNREITVFLPFHTSLPEQAHRDTVDPYSMVQTTLQLLSKLNQPDAARALARASRDAPESLSTTQTIQHILDSL